MSAIPRERLSIFADPAAYAWGGELLLRDGEPVGFASSAAFGHTIGGTVLLGYAGRRVLVVEVEGERPVEPGAGERRAHGAKRTEEGEAPAGGAKRGGEAPPMRGAQEDALDDWARVKAAFA